MGVHGNATHGRIANPPEHQGQVAFGCDTSADLRVEPGWRAGGLAGTRQDRTGGCHGPRNYPAFDTFIIVRIHHIQMVLTLLPL
jgi:hypothetical protein